MTKEPPPAGCELQIKKSRVPRFNTNPVSPSAKKPAWLMPQDIPSTQITIHHKFDNNLHFNHQLNKTIRNINAAIKLIFKNDKDRSAITVSSGGATYSSQYQAIDEDRVRAIQKVAMAMKVPIPKRFESKAALREFIQTREFVQAMKGSMNN